MANGTTWSGSSGLDNALAYVPYVGEDGWSDLGTDLAGMAKIIFGSGVTVEQVTDKSGRRLYVEGKPGAIDTSATGLSRSVIRLPMYGADPERPRATGELFALYHAVGTTPVINTRLQQLETEYADYAGSGQILLAPDTALNDLTFTLSGSDAVKPVRALVSQGGQFLEVRAVGAGPGALHPAMVIHDLANLAAGMTISDRNGAPAQVVFSHGLVSRAAGTVTMQSTETLALSPSLKMQVVDSQLQVVTAGPVVATQIVTRVLEARGRVTAAPARQFMMLRAQ